MKKIISLCAVLCCVASLVSAQESGPLGDVATPAPVSRVGIAPYLSYWNVPDLDGFDLSGAFGAGFIGQVRLHKLLALEFRMSAFGAGNSEEIQVDGQGWYDRYTTIGVMPLEADLIAFLPVTESFSLYAGPGAGYYLFDGEVTRSQGPWTVIYDMDLDDEGGFYGVAGGRIRVARNLSLFGEGKYTWVESSPTYELVDGDAVQATDVSRSEKDLDFSGLALSAGVFFDF